MAHSYTPPPKPLATRTIGFRSSILSCELGWCSNIEIYLFYYQRELDKKSEKHDCISNSSVLESNGVTQTCGPADGPDDGSVCRRRRTGTAARPCACVRGWAGCTTWWNGGHRTDRWTAFFVCKRGGEHCIASVSSKSSWCNLPAHHICITQILLIKLQGETTTIVIDELGEINDLFHYGNSYEYQNDNAYIM